MFAYDKIAANSKDDFEKLILEYEKSYDHKRNPGKYSDAAIFGALIAGMYDFLCKPFIATDYKRIGQRFPARYLES